MTGARYFSKLDASSGYWQTKLDEESSNLLCFNSPFGRYKFNILPFGVSNASEIFQLDIAESVEGIEGAANAQDDIIVWGDTKEVHDQRLHEELSRIKDSGLKLNRKKGQLCVTQITFDQTLCQTAISTTITRRTNRFTVVLWAFPLALLWQTSV
jgi:hypothetical protein